LGLYPLLHGCFSCFVSIPYGTILGKTPTRMDAEVTRFQFHTVQFWGGNRQRGSSSHPLFQVHTVQFWA
jgi:hypothetical protein